MKALAPTVSDEDIEVVKFWRWDGADEGVILLLKLTWLEFTVFPLIKLRRHSHTLDLGNTQLIRT